MKKTLPTVTALVAAAVLQVAIAPHLAIRGVVPNCLLLVAVTLAMVEGPAAGCAAGFGAGLLMDLLGSGPVGPSALVLCIVGYLAGLLAANLFASGWLVPVTVVLVASLTTDLALAAVLAMLDAGSPFFAAFIRVMLPAAVYNTALALLVFPWLARFLRRERPVTTFRRLA